MRDLETAVNLANVIYKESLVSRKLYAEFMCTAYICFNTALCVKLCYVTLREGVGETLPNTAN